MTPLHGTDGHVPVVPPRIGSRSPAADGALLDRLAGIPVADVSDAVGRLYTMDPRIRPLVAPVRRAVGVALTVKAHPGDNLAVHGALGMVQPRDVLVVDWLGYADGCGSGALSLAGPVERGLEAVVVDGGWRDVAQLADQGFPVFGRRETAFSPAKQEPGEINVPVCCGGVIVEAGDVVVADAAGVAVIPLRHLAEVVRALTAGSQEEAVVQPAGSGAPAPPSLVQRHAELFVRRGGVRG